MQLIAPTNSATITTATPTLEWTAFPGAALYQVSVYDNTTSQQVFFQSTQYTQITVSPALQTGRQYGWGVYAYNASGQEIAYYAFWYFTVSGALTVTCIPQSGTYTPGAQYSTTCTASGGTSPYNWSFSNLPSWLTSSATPPYTSIMLSGTVPNPPPYSYAVGVTVADSTFPTGNTGTTTVTINLGVDQLGGNPVSLSNGAGSGKVTTTSTVSNSGSVSTTFTLSSSTVSGGNWLSASAPTNTIPAGGSVDITITADTTQLQPGSYNGTVRVTGTYSTALISVALAVSGVQISASPNPIALGSITPQKQPAATVTVSSTGGTAVVAIGVAIQQGQGSGWLSTDTAQITTNATFHVTVDASSLAPGSYEEFITLQCTAAPCIEVEVPVTFTVVSGPAAPTITAVQNNYSRILPGAPNYGIAPGTLFIVKGTGLADPDSPVVLQDPSKALPQTLYGASASVTVNGVTVKPALYYALDYQLALVLPSNTPVGTGTITVSYEGQPSQPAQLQIVASAFGFGAYDGTLAIATDNADGHLITTNQSAQPGEIIVFWGSGDGADTNNDDVNPPKHFDNLSGTTALYFGGVPVPILYQGRSPYQGVDQVAVTVPFPCTAPDTPAGCTVNPPTGCAVSVVAVIGSGSGASVSNLVTMPIATNGGTCVDPLSYVNPSEIATLANKTTANFGRLSVAQQKSLTGTTETAAASFYSIGGSLLSGYQSTYQPSLGSCFVTQSNSEMPANPFTLSGLDAGTLSVTGPGGTEALSGTQGSPGIYDAQLPSGFVPAAGGTFTFTGTGGADVGPVSAGLSFPSPLIWINSSSDGTVSRTQGVTVDWTGGAPGSFVQISGYSSSQGFSAFFVCDAPASAQSFTVPDSVLLALPAGSGTLAVSTYTNPVGFTAVGLDFGFAMAYASTSINATYQ
jgi:uncharacterized protein (TIGR03437 family)